MSDLRIDGGYSERNSGISYYTQRSPWGTGLWNFSDGLPATQLGMLSFWFKPSFYPELTGKVRQAWDLSRYHSFCNQNVHVWPFQLVFLPSHYNPSFAETNQPRYWHNNMGQFHPASMYWGSKQWHGDEVTPIDGSHRSHSFGKITRSLNHLSADHQDSAIHPSVKNVARLSVSSKRSSRRNV